VELCAKILQIMRNNVKDYARTFCQLCEHYAHLCGLCITHIWHLTMKRTFWINSRNWRWLFCKHYSQHLCSKM